MASPGTSANTAYTSTRSPGRTRPARPVTASTFTAISRSVGSRSLGGTSASRLTGEPAVIGVAITRPSMSALFRTVLSAAQRSGTSAGSVFSLDSVVKAGRSVVTR